MKKENLINLISNMTDADFNAFNELLQLDIVDRRNEIIDDYNEGELYETAKENVENVITELGKIL